MDTTTTDTIPLGRVLAWVAVPAAAMIGWALFAFLSPLDTDLYATGAYVLTGLGIIFAITLFTIETLFRRRMRREGFDKSEIAEATKYFSYGYGAALGISLLSLALQLSL